MSNTEKKILKNRAAILKKPMRPNPPYKMSKWELKELKRMVKIMETQGYILYDAVANHLIIGLDSEENPELGIFLIGQI